jgi:hypothetical protein
MSFSLVLTQSNVVASSNNSIYQYNFLGGNFQMKDNEICITQATIPYSFFNVNPTYGNTITLTFPFATPVGPTILTLTSGFYTVNDINLWFQNYCVANKYYMINSSGQFVYFLAFFTNTTYYQNQIVFTTLPTAAQATTLGWTVPVGATWTLPAAAANMTVAFAASGSIAPLLGFAAGSSYTGTGVVGGDASSVLSTQTPVGSFVNSVILRSNLINNNVGNPTDILDSMPIANSTFGANINYSPSFAKWVSVADGTYSQFNISLFNELLQPIVAQDNRVLINLLIRKKGAV